MLDIQIKMSCSSENVSHLLQEIAETINRHTERCNLFGSQEGAIFNGDDELGSYQLNVEKQRVAVCR